MPQKHWDQLRDLFHRALDVPPAERAAFLKLKCRDGAIRAEVESLLANAGTNMLDSPAVAGVREAIEDAISDGASVAKAPAFEIADKANGVAIGPYRLLQKIGEGGMGEVYKARDTRLDRLVAIKFSRSQFGDRFEREARIVAGLSHPHICQLYDVGPNYLVFEYIDGPPVKGPMPPRDAIQVVLQIADALEEAHSHGIIHRDLKPANILLTARGVKVLDFGLAKQNRKSQKAEEKEKDDLTRPGTVMGTPAYMAPELWEGQLADARSDIYSFGCLLYELLTGERFVHERMPLRDGRLEKVVRKCLAGDPDRRFKTAAELKTALVQAAKSGMPRKYAVLAAALLLVTLGGTFLLSRARAAPKLTDRDTIVLTDFANSTGDPVFDGTLRQGLSVQLEQSPFFKLASDERIADALALMSQRKDARLIEDLAREVCRRTGSAATIEGSITKLGGQYVLGFNAMSCRTGDLLAQEQEIADGKEQVLKALGRATTKLRRKLGESLASVQKYDAPLEDVTTPSLEALQAYTFGFHTFSSTGDPRGAIPQFQTAISIDPNFAMAYLRLGIMYFNLGESGRTAENIRRAYELKNRTSERERLSISAYYEHLVTGNLERSQAADALWARTFPRDEEPWINLCVTGWELGNYKKAIEAAQEAVKLKPESAVVYSDLAATYVSVGRLDEARHALMQAPVGARDAPLYLIEFLGHNSAGMEQAAAQLRRNPSFDDSIAYLESDTAAFSGQMARARVLTRHAVAFAERHNQRESAALYQAEGAVREAILNNGDLAKRDARAALELTDSKDVEGVSAIALALSGDSAKSMQLADNLVKRFPEDTIVQVDYLPMVHSALALRSSYPAKAIEALDAASPYELGGPPVPLTFSLHPAYLRGIAYLVAKQGTAAAVEFQKILDHPGVVLNEPIGALAHLGLARANVFVGDIQKAKTAYIDFFALWKDADPDIPLLIAARKEYAALK
jgi:eukaryotic-like serine/threonine-protein kinase